MKMSHRTLVLKGTMIAVVAVATLGVADAQERHLPSSFKFSTVELATLLAARGVSAGLVVTADDNSPPVPTPPGISTRASAFAQWMRGLRRSIMELKQHESSTGLAPHQLITNFAEINAAAGWRVEPSRFAVETLRNPRAAVCDASLKQPLTVDVQGRTIFRTVSQVAASATGAAVSPGAIRSCLSHNGSIAIPITLKKGMTLEDALNEIAAKFGGTVWVASEAQGACALGFLQVSESGDEVCVAPVTEHLGPRRSVR